jgi:hypothetical protein
MARTVEDIALILDATVGYDAADSSTAASSGRIPRTYVASLKTGALKSARIGVLTEFFGTAPEDGEVATVVRRAIEEMTARGATAIDVEVPDLAKLVAAANLLTQELKFYLGDYLEDSGAYASSVDDLLDSGLHSSSLQGILDIANGIPNDYLTSDDYTARLAARETLGKALTSVMDTNRLDAIVYPTIRRIAPVVGGAQAGSNAALSSNTGFPAISVPAGFTPGGFPVGVELIGRRLPSRHCWPGVRLRASHASSTPASAGRRTPGVVSVARWRVRRGASGRDGEGRALVTSIDGGFSRGGAIHVHRSDTRTDIRHPDIRYGGRRRRRLFASTRESTEWRCGVRAGQVVHTPRHRSGHAHRG